MGGGGRRINHFNQFTKINQNSHRNSAAKPLISYRKLYSRHSLVSEQFFFGLFVCLCVYVCVCARVVSECLNACCLDSSFSFFFLKYSTAE